MLSYTELLYVRIRDKPTEMEYSSVIE